MTDFTVFKVDLDTARPNPNNNTQVLRGDAPRTAFTKYNDMLDLLHTAVNHVGAEAPSPTSANMTWLDTSTDPPQSKRRNSTDTAWVVVESTLPKASSGIPSLAQAREMAFQLVSDTSLKIFVRGVDGTTRSATLILS